VDLFSEFVDIVLDIRDAIDLVLDFQLANLPHYSLNLAKRAESNRQVQDLLSKSFIR